MKDQNGKRHPVWSPEYQEMLRVREACAKDDPSLAKMPLTEFGALLRKAMVTYKKSGKF